MIRIWEIWMDTYFYEIWSYFGPRSRLVKPTLKRCTVCRLSRNLALKVDFITHLRDKHGHLFLWNLELFWTSLKVGLTKVENMHFCRLSRNWVLKVYLVTHLRDNHGHLVLWYLELFWPLLKVGQTKVNMHFFSTFSE